MAEESTKKRGRLAAAVIAGSTLAFGSFAMGIPAALADEEETSPVAVATQEAVANTAEPDAPDDVTTPPAGDNGSDDSDDSDDAPASDDGEDAEPVEESAAQAQSESAAEPAQEEATGTQETLQLKNDEPGDEEPGEGDLDVPIISLDVFEGTPGSTVNISGVDFEPGNQVEIRLDSASDDGASTVLSSATAGDNGQINASVTIPEDTALGEYLIVADDEAAGASSSVTFSVVEEVVDDDDGQQVDPSLYVNPGSGPAGSTIGLNGSGFTEDGEVEVSVAPADGGDAVVSETFTADDGGSLNNQELTIPEDADNGIYHVTALDVESGEASDAADFNVTDITLDVAPETLSEEDFQNTGVTLTVEGLESGDVVDFQFGNTYNPIPSLAGSATANEDGTAKYTVQQTEGKVFVGTYSVNVNLAEGGPRVASGSFEVTSELPQVSAFPQEPTDDGAVLQGGILNVSGHNVTPDNSVTVDFGIDGVENELLQTETSGDFFTEFEVPQDTEPGVKELTVRDDETGAVGTAEYTVAADGPQISLESHEVYQGGELEVEISNLTPNGDVKVEWNPEETLTANAEGRIDTELDIDDDAETGVQTLTVTDVATGDSNSVEYTVLESTVVDPALTITPERITLENFVGEPEDGAGVAHVVEGLEPGAEITYLIAGPEYVNDYESTEIADENGVAQFVIRGYEVANPAVYLGEYRTVVTYIEEDGDTAALNGDFTVVEGDGSTGGSDGSGDSDNVGPSGPADLNGYVGLAQTGATGMHLGFLAGGLLLLGAAFVAYANRARLFGRKN